MQLVKSKLLDKLHQSALLMNKQHDLDTTNWAEFYQHMDLQAEIMKIDIEVTDLFFEEDEAKLMSNYQSINQGEFIMNKPKTQEFEAFATLTAPVSLSIAAQSRQAAHEVACTQLDEMSIDSIEMTVKLTDGSTQTLHVHDHHLHYSTLFADDEC
ncbi:hypothetical protein [Salsuginibacillus kocurii]|uniref:hypothetical protein n=1 Tax=Salsuginibacillus kocurii TaxID=427078 RepID=UPI000375C41C|nr:hypothetical protein [Salsuginibacillus kocurii]